MCLTVVVVVLAAAAAVAERALQCQDSARRGDDGSKKEGKNTLATWIRAQTTAGHANIVASCTESKYCMCGGGGGGTARDSITLKTPSSKAEEESFCFAFFILAFSSPSSFLLTRSSK